MRSLSYRSIAPIHPEMQQRKNKIEQQYIKQNAVVVNVLLLLIIIPLIVILHAHSAKINVIFMYGVFFLVTISINVALAAYKEVFDSIKMSRYVNTFSVYVIATLMIIQLQSMSLFPLLFLSYAIVALYQERVSMIINNILLLIMGVLTIRHLNNVLNVNGLSGFSPWHLYIFLLMFVALLSIASYLLIKRKRYLYASLATVKENELRMMNKLLKLVSKYRKRSIDYQEYYAQTRKFAKKISEEIGIEDIFSQRIAFLEDCHNLNNFELRVKYPMLKDEEIDELKDLVLNDSSYFLMLIYRASQTKNIESMTEFMRTRVEQKSLHKDHQQRDISIIAFIAFYSLIKTRPEIIPQLKGEEIKSYIESTEFYYIADRKIIDYYLKYWTVFEEIFNDAFKEKVAR